MLKRSFHSLVPILIMLLLAEIAHGQGVAVELTQFGVGSTFRGGNWTGIRVKLTSALEEITQVRVQWETEDADGDIAEHSRVVALTPNQPTTRWLYAWLSPSVNPDHVWTVRVFEDEDGVRGDELGMHASPRHPEHSALQRTSRPQPA